MAFRRRTTVLGDAVLILRGDTRAFERSMKRAKKMTISVVKGIVSVIAKIHKAFAAVTTGIVSASILAFAQLEKGLAEISTLFGVMGQDAKVLQERIKETVQVLQSEFGQSTAAAIKATYDAVSAGIKETDLGGFMRDAAKLAIAGVTDISQSVDVLTSVVNAYGMSASDANDVSDKLFTAVKLGKTTITELSGSIGRLAPIASAAGLSLDEMLSGVAGLTAQGLSTEEAVTGMRGAITAMLKPTTDAQKAMKELGVDISASALQSKGFAGILEDVARATGGNAEAMAKLFPEIRGMNAMLALTSEQGLAKFNTGMNDMRDSAGATENAFGVMSDTIAFKFTTLKGSLMTLLQTIGDIFAEPVKIFLDIVGGALKEEASSIKEWWKENRDEIQPILNKLAETAAWGVAFIMTNYKAAGKAVLEWIGDHAGSIDKITASARNAMSLVTEFIGGVLEQGKGKVDEIKKKLEEIPKKLKQEFEIGMGEALEVLFSFETEFIALGAKIGWGIGKAMAVGTMNGWFEFIRPLREWLNEFLGESIGKGAFNFFDFLSRRPGNFGSSQSQGASAAPVSNTRISQSVTVNGSGLDETQLQRAVGRAFLDMNRVGGLTRGALV